MEGASPIGQPSSYLSEHGGEPTVLPPLRRSIRQQVARFLTCRAQCWKITGISVVITTFFVVFQSGMVPEKVVWYFQFSVPRAPASVGSLNDRRGELSSPQPSATRIRPDFARMECQKYHFGLVFPVSYFHFATDSPQIGQFCAGRRPADENFAPPPAIFDFWQQVAICPRSGIFTTKKWYLPLVGSPAPGALGSPGPAYR